MDSLSRIMQANMLYDVTTVAKQVDTSRRNLYRWNQREKHLLNCIMMGCQSQRIMGREMPVPNRTADEHCIDAGLIGGVEELSDICGISVRRLKRWCNEHKRVFMAAAIGANDYRRYHRRFIAEEPSFL